MGNCHTVGPNEALVVSGEGAAREVGLGRPIPEVFRVGTVLGKWVRRGFCVGARLGSE